MDAAEFSSDITVRHELIGTPSLLITFLQNTSSQRALMQANAIVQAEVLEGNECSRIQTGFETKYGRYQFDESRRDQDIQILEVIPKFRISVKNDGTLENPTLTVIYLGADDNRIGYFNVNTYTFLHSGFGYMNNMLNQFQLQKGNFIPKETKFISAPNHDGDIYNLGTMANCCYIPMWDTTDDAFIISETLAKKCTHTVMDEMIINIRPDSIPLNLYGNDEIYQCMPNIGEEIRNDGILMAFRQKTDSSFLTDLTASALCEPEYLHDDIFKAPPGAKILDIQLFTNQKIYLNLDGPYQQLMDYQDQHNRYYADIIDAYENLTREGYKCRPEFANLVTKCKGLCYTRGGKSMILMDKKEPIDFIRIKITYAFKQAANIGSKLTGIEGSKGVVSSIWKDEDMPVGPNGIRADLIITAESPFNRLNSGQLTSQFIVYASDVIRDRVVHSTMTTEEAYEYIIGFINEVRPVYAKFLREETSTSDEKEEFVEAVKQDGIYFIIPSFCESITPDMYIRIAEKYGIDRGPLTYYTYDKDGNRKKIVTKYEGIVGGRYIYLLGKRPLDQLNVIEFGYINQFMTPMKPNSKIAKAQCIHGQTPMRYGEDEIANLTSLIGTEATARITGLYSNSPVALEELNRRLLTDPYPSAINHIDMSTKDIVETSSNIALFKHQFAETGFILKEVEVEKEVKND